MNYLGYQVYITRGFVFSATFMTVKIYFFNLSDIYPLFMDRSWHSCVRCMFFYVL